MMGARLQVHIERRATRARSGRLERERFRVSPAVPSMSSFSDDFTIRNDDSADHGVRRRLSPPELSEVQGAPHVNRLGVGRRCGVTHVNAYQPNRRPAEP